LHDAHICSEITQHVIGGAADPAGGRQCFQIEMFNWITLFIMADRQMLSHPFCQFGSTHRHAEWLKDPAAEQSAVCRLSMFG
jgi:hypothetical protein